MTGRNFQKAGFVWSVALVIGVGSASVAHAGSVAASPTITFVPAPPLIRNEVNADPTKQSLQQVEFKAYYVSINSADVEKLGLKSTLSVEDFREHTNDRGNRNNSIQELGFVQGNFQDRLQALSEQGRAKIICAEPHQIMSVNNHTASLSHGNLWPITPAYYLESHITLTLKPLINGNGVVTCTICPEVAAGMREINRMGEIDGPFTPLKLGSTTENFVANLGEGDTIFLRGLYTKDISRRGISFPVISSIADPLLALPDFKEAKKIDNTEKEILIFLQARVLPLETERTQEKVTAQSLEGSNVPSEDLNIKSNQGYKVMALSFKKVPVTDLFRLIAGHSGVNIIVADDVKGSIEDINLSNVRVEDVLRNICRLAHLQYEKTDHDTYLISSASENP